MLLLGLLDLPGLSLALGGMLHLTSQTRLSDWPGPTRPQTLHSSLRFRLVLQCVINHWFKLILNLANIPSALVSTGLDTQSSGT